VSRPLDGLDPPLVAAEAEQVERTRRRTWSRPDPRFCALQALSDLRNRIKRTRWPSQIPSRTQMVGQISSGAEDAPRTGAIQRQAWNSG
jgi:hypothetical protein